MPAGVLCLRLNTIIGVKYSRDRGSKQDEPAGISELVAFQNSLGNNHLKLFLVETIRPNNSDLAASVKTQLRHPDRLS
jgi:hypothetical protein